MDHSCGKVDTVFPQRVWLLSDALSLQSAFPSYDKDNSSRMEGLLSKMRTILAAVDQSHHAHDVMSRAAELAVLLRNDLVVLSVISSDPMKQFSIVDEQNRFASFHRELIFKHFPENSLAVEPHNGTGGVYKHGTAGVRIQSRILSGNVVDKICACAEEFNADLVLVGSRGLGNIGSLVLGSVSERVVHKSTRSVLVVKGERLEGPDWQGLSNSQNSGAVKV